MAVLNLCREKVNQNLRRVYQLNRLTRKVLINRKPKSRRTVLHPPVPKDRRKSRRQSQRKKLLSH